VHLDYRIGQAPGLQVVDVVAVAVRRVAVLHAHHCSKSRQACCHATKKSSRCRPDGFLGRLSVSSVYFNH
jgi:hypothetical protein